LDKAWAIYLATFRPNRWSSGEDAGKQIDADARDVDRLYEEWITAFGQAVMVVPQQVHHGLGEVSENLRSYTVWLDGIQNASPADRPNPASEHFRSDLMKMRANVQLENNKVGGCLSTQFSDGKPLDGDKFADCMSGPASDTPQNPQKNDELPKQTR
jgi:hypothetical protein